jgi:glycine cleavage system aminomethyltransferase T
MGRAPGSVIYTAMLNARGTFESDLTAQRLTEDHYRLCVGTTAIKRDLAWLRAHADGFDVQVDDTTETYAILGLMGPDTARIAAKIGAPGLNEIGYFKHAEAEIAGHAVRAARLSYVGEAGWEITCRAEAAPAVYQTLRDSGATPAGLFAQTSMRIEKGFCAMGHELDGDVTPPAVGLDFAVRPSGGFIGADALAQARAPNGLVTVVFDDPTAVPLGHEPIYLDGHIIGETSSAAFGYRIGAPLALAHLRTRLGAGQRVTVDIAGAHMPAKTVIGPAFDPKGLRMRPATATKAA